MENGLLGPAQVDVSHRGPEQKGWGEPRDSNGNKEKRSDVGYVGEIELPELFHGLDMGGYEKGKKEG